MIKFAGRTVWAALSVGTLFIAALLILSLPESIRNVRNLSYIGPRGVSLDPDRYWQYVTEHLAQLLSGTFFAPGASHLDPSLFPAQLRITITLIITGAVTGVLAGIVAGWAISSLSPRLLRACGWLGTTLLLAVPDLILVVALQILVYQVSQRFGWEVPVYGGVVGSNTWRHFLFPSGVLALIVAPQVARLLAASLDEVRGQPYIRAAMARGIPLPRLLLKYLGRNALVLIWPALPSVVGVLLSATPVVEYLVDMPGLGRQLIRYPTGYEAAVTLLPLLSLTVITGQLVSAGQRWLNPAHGIPPGLTGRVRGKASWVASLRDLLTWIARGFGSLRGAPGRALRALARNPALLAGSVLVLGLVGIAVFADHLAPYPWDREEVLRIEGVRLITPPYPPGPQNLLGSDRFGRDILSRLVWGTRFTLLFACMAVPLRFLIALPLGMAAAGRPGGLLESAVRSLAITFGTVPAVLLPLALIPGVNALTTGKPLLAALGGALVLSLPGVPKLAESIRLMFREVMGRTFIEGAVAGGATGTRILLRHVLPHTVPFLLVLGALEVPAIITVTGFLGMREVHVGGSVWDPETGKLLGPYMPEWGAMLGTPFRLLSTHMWWLWSPFVALLIAVMAFTLLGEGLRRGAARRSEQ